jgi:osmoprotectant transport system ATP-binding protein
MPVIEFDHVTCFRGGRPVVDDVSLQVAPGESIALVGRSGAGKSTALRLINGLLRPDAGSVRVEGRDTREWDPYALRRQAGFVLQEIALFPHMTVHDNVAVVPRLLKWNAARIDARVDELLALVDLPAATFASRAPDELSGGQRQRVAVARALAGDPAILLMDEPFGALDPLTRRDLRAEVRRIQQRVRKTLVLVTHDMDEALELADRIGVMASGRLLAMGTADEIGRSSDPHVRDLFSGTDLTRPRSPGRLHP